MNIREELLKYHLQSREQALRIAEYAVSPAQNFQELIQCFLSEEVRLAQRAAWSVSWAAQKDPDIVYPHIDSLVSQLKKTDVHPAVIRNSVRILQELEIPEEFHGEVMSACFDFIQKREIPVAIKAFALKILFNLSRCYPDIKKELRLIILENIEFQSPAFQSRARKILMKI